MLVLYGWGGGWEVRHGTVCDGVWVLGGGRGGLSMPSGIDFKVKGFLGLGF